MKKTFLLSLVLLMCFMCVACTQTSVNSADEIRMNKWSMKTEFDKTVTLSFLGDKGSFQVESTDKDACVKLEGLCIIDKNKIALYNESDKENYIFKYKLKGNKLKLIYMDGKITLLREKKENPPA